MYAVDQWDIIEKENSRKSAIVTAIISLLLFLLLFFWVLGWPKEDEMPLQGMMIDFGTTETGQGSTSAPVPKTETITPIEETNPTSEPQVSPSVADQVETQDLEEAIVITPDKEDPTPTQEELEAAQAAIEAQQQAEAEAAVAAQAALEAQQQAEADALAEQLNNAWGDGNGDGNDGTPGDAGNPDGVPNGGDGSGLGDSGSGPALWGLGGRKWAKPPKVVDDSQRFGKVTLKIKVDKSGNIISAEFTNYKSTTTDAVLIQRAKDALKHAKVTSDVNAASEDWGYVTFNFTAK